MGIRKPGLWHGPRRVEVQTVKPAMRRSCERCGGFPSARRLAVSEGVGRGQKQFIYCEVCGDLWLEARAAEVKRAMRYLQTGKGSVREAN